jgi:DNA-binding Lrp family transcriptional regulator
MKEVELKLVSELMKNSRRSDRELARVLGVSQPTVTRMRTRLEKQGYIKEYTMIPDFPKVGYHLLSLTFVKLRKTLSPEDTEKARECTRRGLREVSFGIVMVDRGLGFGYDGAILSFHEDYSGYEKYRAWLKHHSFLDLSAIESFLINLDDVVRYRPLTFAALAQHLLTLKSNNSTLG